MIWFGVVAYHVIVVILAYRFGERSAGRGVAVFFFGVFAFQMVVNGPGSLLDGGCEDYSIHASSC